MNVTDIKDIPSVFRPGTADTQPSRQDALSDFKQILKESIGSVNELQTEANQSVVEMISGRKDIHSAMIDMEMAGISFRLLLQVRNKMVAAYEEIMKMQF